MYIQNDTYLYNTCVYEHANMYIYIHIYMYMYIYKYLYRYVFTNAHTDVCKCTMCMQTSRFLVQIHTQVYRYNYTCRKELLVQNTADTACIDMSNGSRNFCLRSATRSSRHTVHSSSTEAVSSRPACDWRHPLQSPRGSKYPTQELLKYIGGYTRERERARERERERYIYIYMYIHVGYVSCEVWN